MGEFLRSSAVGAMETLERFCPRYGHLASITGHNRLGVVRANDSEGWKVGA